MNNYFLKPNQYFFILFSCVFILLIYVNDFPGGTLIKNPPAHARDVRDMVLSLSPEDHLQEEMVTHSSILAWEIPWTEKSDGLHSP